MRLSRYFGLVVVGVVLVGLAACNSAAPSGAPGISRFAASPTSLGASGGSTSLSWSGSNITDYTLTVTPGAGVSANGTAYTGAIDAGTATSASVTVPANATSSAVSYTFTLTGSGASGTTPATKTATVSVAASPPPAPTGVAAASAAGSVSVSWSESGTGVTGFTVYRWVAGSGGSATPSTKLVTASATARSYRDFAVQPSTSYVYAVAATGSGGTSNATQATSGAQATPVTLAVVVRSVPDQTALAGAAGRYMTSHPSVTVNITVPSGNYQTYVGTNLGATPSTVDVAQLDVIWPGQYASVLTDVEAAAGTSVSGNYFPYESAMGTIGGKLLAVPWYADVGLLYYRTDLLSKYGYSSPPTTWAQLTTMAQAIQTGERGGGNASFWGYVWQGNAYETLTCNALEWFASSGGGTIISSSGVITVNNPQAVAALKMAAGWVGTISPATVTSFQEEDARAVWDAGNAAFMRNWGYAYALTAANSNLAGKFGVAVLPSSSGSPGTGTLGGWMLGISSTSAHPGVAANFVLYATSKAEEVHIATDAGELPSRPDVYSDAAVQAALPFYNVALSALTSAVARPSVVTGTKYGQVSMAVWTRVHNALTGTSTPSTALANLESDLVSITGFPTGAP